jgi:hypothetical protein
VSREQGRVADALGELPGGAGHRRGVAKAEPANADWQSKLFYWHGKMGGVLLRQGNLADALSSHRTALGIAERFAKSNPGNLGWQWNLTSSTHNVAAVLYAKGDRAGALASGAGHCRDAGRRRRRARAQTNPVR